MRIPNPKSGWKQRHLTRCWILPVACNKPKIGPAGLGHTGMDDLFATACFRFGCASH